LTPSKAQPLIVTLSGEFDIQNRDALRESLSPALDHPHVVVDLSDVTYLDSSALAAFIAMRGTRREKGFSAVHFVITSPHLRKLFEVTQFDQLWPIFDSAAEAAEAF
jgi:anti-sigma B factor antagonist